MQFGKTTMRMLAFALAGGAIWVLDAAPGQAGPPCDPVSGTGATAVDVPFVFEGFATVVIRGVEFEFDVTTVLLGDPVEGDDGTLHVETSHTFSLDDVGDFTTTDKAVADPLDEPGLFRLNSTLRITTGTGAFEGVSGRLTVHGEIDLFDEINGVGFPFFGESSWDVHGVVCD